MADANESKIKLLQRSDGFLEDAEGRIAVVMTSMVAAFNHPETDELLKYFEFKSSFSAPVVRVEWPAHEVVSVFPGDIVSGLLSKGYARPPTPVEVREHVHLVTLREEMVPEEDAGSEEGDKNPDPQPDATPAPEPTSAPAPAADVAPAPAAASAPPAPETPAPAPAPAGKAKK